MIVRDGHIYERGLSFSIAHVLSFRSWQVFTAVYLHKILPQMEIDIKKKLLKDVYVHALLNDCTKSNTQNVKQTNSRRRCQQK